MLPILAMLTSTFIIDAIELGVIVYVGTGAVIEVADRLINKKAKKEPTKDETEAMKALEERINHLADNAEEIFTKVNEVASKTIIAPVAIATLGWGATSTAIAICFAAGGVATGKAILNAVRNNYKIAEKVENSDGKVTKLVLKRK